MTPAEFLLYLEGYKFREELAWRRTAWQTAHLLNIWLKKEDRVTVDDLLKQKETPKEPQTVEDQMRIMEAWVAALGGVDRRRKKRKGGAAGGRKEADGRRRRQDV